MKGLKIQQVRLKSNKLRILILLLAIFVVYVDTLTLHYASDDRMIIYENDFTLKGFHGVKEVLTEDAFCGFFGKEQVLVAGGRYRPLSQLTFILEYELFGNSIRDKVGIGQAPQNEQLFTDSILPVVQHGGNLLLFMLLCISILAVLRKLFSQFENERWYYSVPFMATLLFALHPLHTEAVANIKGRDEIMSMLGAVLALYAILRFTEKRRWYDLLLAFVAMLLALFSKENAITFLAIVPLSLYFYPQTKKTSDYFLTLLPLVTATAIFLWARTHALGGLMNESTSTLILNNPFLHTTKAQELATILLTWGIYLKLMLLPHPLTHDYYPHHIEITNFANPLIWLLCAGVIFLLVFSIKTLKQKKLASFGILFFIITFSITSNLLFNVGTFMNERFLFTSLLGFTLIVSFLIQKLQKTRISGRAITIGVLLLCLLYGGKTAARNLVWKNDITLFTTDVNISKNSLKCNIAAGGSYLKLYEQSGKKKQLRLAEQYLTHAIELGGNTSELYSLLGKLYFFKEDYNRARRCYETIIASDSNNTLAINNLNVTIAALEDKEVEQISAYLSNGNVEQALQLAQKFYEKNPQSAQALNQLGRVYGQGKGNLTQAISYLEQAILIDPNFVSALENLAIAYASRREIAKAEATFTHARQLDPTNEHLMDNMTRFYKNIGKPLPEIEPHQ